MLFGRAGDVDGLALQEFKLAGSEVGADFACERRQHYVPTGAAMMGCVVGAGEPATGSTVTATIPSLARSIGPFSIWTARVPSDWNRPAGRGAPPLGITHISYALPCPAGGRLDAIRSTP